SIAPTVGPPATAVIEAPLITEGLPAGARRALPAQLVHGTLRDLDAIVRRAQPGQRAVEHHLVPPLAERGGEDGRAAQARDVPRGRLGRDRLERAVPRQDRRRGFRAPAR